MRHCCRDAIPFYQIQKLPLVKSSISVTKRTALSTPTKSSPLSERADNEEFYLFCRLTITLSRSTNTRLFNDYNGTGSRNPHKTHKTPPQNCLQRGSLMCQNSRKALFQAVFGHRKIHRNSIKITVDLWWTRRDSNP